tara:strand:- start:45762 stop:46295 length:534 start_codon:yes stop_codon:yes gene_type:complete
MEHKTTTTTVDICTGSKSEFYTLWVTRDIDLRPRNADGSIKEMKTSEVINSIGGHMYLHSHTKFVQNLAKTPEEAFAKALELGYKVTEEDFSFNLKNYSKPSTTAFGTKMKHKRKWDRRLECSVDVWSAEATPTFWEVWREDKDTLKEMGWALWKSPKGAWYMFLNIPDLSTKLDNK